MIIDRAQHIRRMLDILDRELLEQLGDWAIAAFQRLGDGAVIFVRTADRFLEDRRIGRDALDAVGIDQLFQVAPGDEAAGQEIQPDRLAVFFERFDGIHDALFCSSGSIFGFQHLSQAGSRILSTNPWGGADRGEYAFPHRVTPFTTFRSRKSALWRRSRCGFVTAARCRARGLTPRATLSRPDLYIRSYPPTGHMVDNAKST